VSAIAQDIVSRIDAYGVKRQRLTVDSRSVAPGDVFIALPGAKVDGRKFAAAAQVRGAAAILCETGPQLASEIMIPVIHVDDLSLNLGEIADVFYDQPSTKIHVLGVTGTNGKTSIASWLAQALSLLGQPCGSVGTLGVCFGDRHWATQNTTPDAASVHTTLRDLHADGAEAVAMEVSSHALELGRVKGVRFKAVIFTNLTQDHLDFHGSMAAYGSAKARLFTDYPVLHRIINADDAFGADLIKRALPNTVSFGLESGAVRGAILAMSLAGMQISVSYQGNSSTFSTKLIGRFNASNLLAVAATLLATGTPLLRVTETLAQLSAAPGRMQRVNEGSDEHDPNVFVDYAHTPDALAKALETVRQTKPASLAVVFGCGGDRDRSKRPQMGAIAADHADHVYVTSDNPRSESPDTIIAEIAAGVATQRRTALKQVVSRREAIRMAISAAGDSDAVLIAGKGHESYQEINGVRHAFSDVDEARVALTMRREQVQRSAAENRHVVR
jgi:UDP-N-acetylmuramoyl-L-alanyl-D-glutamate--2,6-diaminopimelate ligase